MPNPTRLQILADLRRQARPRLNQTAVAKIFGLDPEYGRKAVGTWEQGENSPDKERRTPFIGYLWDDLGLRSDPEKFEAVWQILVAEWGWAPISDEEWKTFTTKPRPRPQAKQTSGVEPLLPAPTALPNTDGFIGRQQELIRYTDMLTQYRVAIITGLIGVGKTMLAAQLARMAATPSQIFWHVCYPNQGNDVLIWKLAEFLAWHGQDEIWRLLHTGIQVGGRPPAAALIDYLFQLLGNQNYLLCFDDFHYVENDPTQAKFLDQLRQFVKDGALKVILTSQQALRFNREIAVEPLDGLSKAETQLLLADRDVPLEEKVFEPLYAATEGNPQLLILAIEVLRHQRHSEHFIENLVHSEQIRQFLLEEVDRHLNNLEQAVMNGVAALLGYPGSAAAIEEVLDGGGAIPRTLALLSNRYLLERKIVLPEPEYSQHTILQAFYYDLLSKRQRQTMHRRAANYYEYEEQNLLKAAIHYQHAQDHERSAELATENVRRVLYQGEAQALLMLLETFTAQKLTLELWSKVKLACGQVYTFLDLPKPAEDNYREAFTLLTSLAQAERWSGLQVEACRGLGFLLRGRKPEEGLGWLQRGLDLLAGADPIQEADLLIQLGITLGRIKNNREALLNLHQALDQLTALIDSEHNGHIPRLRLLALINLGIRYFYADDFQQCNHYMQRAISLAEQLGDPFNLLSIQTNLAAYRQSAGQWTEALQCYKAAQELALKLGNRQEQAKLNLNSGVLYTQMGNEQQAGQNLNAALACARQIEHNELILASLAYLADLHLSRGNLTDGEIALKEADALSVQAKIVYQRPLIERLWAQYHLATQEYPQAVELAQRSLTTAEQVGMHQEEGASWRVLGQAHLALHDYATGERDLQKSVMRSKNSPYEMAQTKLVLARHLRAQGDIERSDRLLQEAQELFEVLGVQQTGK